MFPKTFLMMKDSIISTTWIINLQFLPHWGLERLSGSVQAGERIADYKQWHRVRGSHGFTGRQPSLLINDPAGECLEFAIGSFKRRSTVKFILCEEDVGEKIIMAESSDSRCQLWWSHLIVERTRKAFQFMLERVIDNKHRKEIWLIKPLSQPQRRNHQRYVSTNPPSLRAHGQKWNRSKKMAKAASRPFCYTWCASTVPITAVHVWHRDINLNLALFTDMELHPRWLEEVRPA